MHRPTRYDKKSVEIGVKHSYKFQLRCPNDINKSRKNAKGIAPSEQQLVYWIQLGDACAIQRLYVFFINILVLKIIRMGANVGTGDVFPFEI